MKKRQLSMERVVSLVAFIFLTASFICSIVLDGDPLSIIPRTEIVIPVVHLVCAIAAFVSIFYPIFPVQFLIMQVESVLTILTTYEQLGIFLFYGSVFLLLCKDYTSLYTKPKMIAVFTIHVLALIGHVTHGIPYMCLAIFTSAFYMAFFIWIYYILKIKFSCFIPTKVTTNSILSNKMPGSQLSLSEYDLTERQINFILDYLNENATYKTLSEKYFVSLSAVKKDFRKIFQTFNVTKIEELYILLLKFQVSK